MQWYPIHVKGHGFCFLYSIKEALSKDHNISLELPQTRQLILDHLCHNTEKYLTFYMNISCDALITSSNLLLEEIIGFIDNGNFNTNVVDLLVQITADALSLEIFILQNNDGSIQILHVPGGRFAKKIYFKFTHNNKYTAANHYILLIKNHKCQDTTPWPAGYIMKLGIDKQTEVMDLSTSSAHYSKSRQNEETNEELSLPSIVRTLDHMYARDFEECEYEYQDAYEKEEDPYYSSHINSSQMSTTTQQEEMESDGNESTNNSQYDGEECLDVDETPIPGIKKGKPFPTYLWDNLEPIECTEIPKDINGFKKYIVHTSDDTWHDDMADSRYFELKTSS